MTLLTVVLFLPLVGALVTLSLGKSQSAARTCALGFALATFVLSLGLIEPVLHNPPSGWSFATDFSWIDNPAVHFSIALDGISLWLVLLATLMSVVSIGASWNTIQKRSHVFFALILMAQCGIVGVFVSLDLVLFYLFWELCLVPVYLMLGVWGRNRSTYSAMKFYIYTMAGSVLMLASIIFLYARSGSLDIPLLTVAIHDGRVRFSDLESLFLFLGFFAAFAIKVPIVPFHGWLTDAYVDSPIAGTILLSAVMSKLGTYGLLRLGLGLFPGAAQESAPWVVALSVIGIIYCALIALVQTDIKRLIAYSSVSHLGFVVLGIFSFHQNGMDGAVYQMVSHGISTGALFLLVGFLQERRDSTAIRDFAGLALSVPNLATAFMIAMLASMGLPLLSNFVGEFLILQGASLQYFSWAAFAAVGVILSACYLLWMYQRVFFGVATEGDTKMPDLGGRELVCVMPLLVLVVWMGVFTQSFMPPISSANSRSLASVLPHVPAVDSNRGTR